MPIYEYECSCGYHFEAIRPFSHSDFTTCPHCKQIAERVMSPCNWSFGWRPTEKANTKGNNPYEYEKDV